MRIGELSRRTGVSTRSLRYYEEQGLLSSTRTAGGHREYGEEAPERVDRIQCLFSAGLNSDTVRELLPCMYAQERGDPAPDLLDWLRAERERVDDAVRQMERTRDALDAVIRDAGARGTGTRDAAPPGAPARVPMTGYAHRNSDTTPRTSTTSAARRRP
ncbi:MULTISPECIES: MerR family transcriptional regulator [unclassified Nocardiopsis]|uniref:MerR family transcriptional regulator n=1 Tax=unclassified Nocardiopsis TaxID=2649073 RepID=UPI00135891A4|nr:MULTISPECIES: MerR family transcriptional regulator [unclassified Nocardiopsis]